MMRAPITKRALFGHAAIPFLAAVYLTLFPWDVSLLSPNSDSYLAFSSEHSLAYPVFIELIKMFFEDQYSIVYAQVWLYAFAAFSVSISVRKISGSNFFGLLAVLPICLNPFVNVTHYTIEATSIFISFSLIMLACLISGFARAGFFNLVGFGFFMGLSILLLPMGWAYLALFIFVVPILSQQEHCSLGKAILLPLMICTALITLESTTHASLHDREPKNSASPSFFAKAALMDTEQVSPYASKDPRTQIWQMIEKDLHSARRAIWQETDFNTRQALLDHHEKTIQNKFAIQAFLFAATTLDKSIDDVKMDIASSRIIQDPWAFIKVGLDHYRNIWSGENVTSLLFWALSIVCIVVCFWSLILGKRFCPCFASAYAAALAIQALTFWVAYTGLGSDAVIMLLSPFLVQCVISLILGIYVTFINPIRTNG